MFVVNQMTGILQGMTWSDLRTILFSQKKVTLVLMTLIGILAVTPMMMYDWVTVEILEGHGKPRLRRKYLLTSAWTTNTLNNLAGFGGVIGATLRAKFYGDQISTKKTIATVSKVALFMLTGLSFLCLMTGIDIYFIRTDNPFRNYWIWLLVGSLLWTMARGLRNIFNDWLFVRSRSSLINNLSFIYISYFYRDDFDGARWHGDL